MSEVFFILTVVYVAYIVSTVTEAEKQIEKPAKTKDISDTDKSPNSEQIKTEKLASAAPKKVVTGKAKLAKATKPKVNAKAAPKIELRTVEMKNPKTGEQAKIASNYRMVKRWVKEALVEEGLLEKIYKTNEMDEAAKATVSEALSIIKAMDKYKV